MIKGTRKPYTIKRLKPIEEYLLRSIHAVPFRLDIIKLSVYDEELKQVNAKKPKPAIKPRTTYEELLVESGFTA